MLQILFCCYLLRIYSLFSLTVQNTILIKTLDTPWNSFYYHVLLLSDAPGHHGRLLRTLLRWSLIPFSPLPLSLLSEQIIRNSQVTTQSCVILDKNLQKSFKNSCTNIYLWRFAGVPRAQNLQKLPLEEICVRFLKIFVLFTLLYSYIWVVTQPNNPR